MKKKTLTVISLLFKQLFFNGTIIFFFSILQFYWSMREFSDSLSSACLKCPFLEDVFLFSLISTFSLIFIFHFCSLIKNRLIKIIIEFLSLITIWSLWNYSIFNSRESSWSTYLFNEEIHYIIYLSYFPILILSTISIFIINSNIKKTKQT